MNAGVILLAVPTLCYLGQAAWFAARGDYAMAVVFLGYVFANFGLIAVAARA